MYDFKDEETFVFDTVLVRFHCVHFANGTP